MALLEVLPARVQAPMDVTSFHQWVFPDGTLWTEFFRTPAGYLLRFPAMADFEVSVDGGRVRCWPAPGTSSEDLKLLYANQTLPLALSKQGKLVLHASAVEVGDDAIAFIAESGRGKSTLAASFASNGLPCITDDGLLVDTGGDAFHLAPSAPSLRLWDDSLDELIGPNARLAPAAGYTTKSRLLACESLPFASRPRPARRLYFLGPGDAAETVFEPLSPKEALVELVKHSFLLDIEEQDALKTHFDVLTRLVRQPICYRLDYPRRYEALAGVRSGILEHAGLKAGTS